MPRLLPPKVIFGVKPEDLISARPDALIGLIQKTRADQTSKHYARFEDHMKRQTSVARLGGVSQALVASFIRNAVINGRKSEKFQSLDAVCGLASELLALGIGIYRISASSTTTAEVTLEKMYPCSSIGMHLLLQKADTELSLMIPINPHQDPSVATDWTVVRVADRMQNPLDVSKELAVRMGFRYFLHAFNPRQLENYCLGYLMPKDGVHEIRLDLTGVPADIRFLVEGCQVRETTLSKKNLSLLLGNQNALSHLCHPDSQRQPQTSSPRQLLAGGLCEPRCAPSPG